MPKEATFDIETDSINATRVWCAAVLDHETGDIATFTPESIDELMPHLQTFDRLFGHNAIDFDLSVLRRLYGWEYNGRVTDTMYVSRAISPNRRLPPGCTDTRVTPHSVEAFGIRFGNHKTAHEDWSRYTSAMLGRCVQDVKLQREIWAFLEEEMAERGWNQRSIDLICQEFVILRRMYDRGWKVDTEKLEWSIAYLDRYMQRVSDVLAPVLPRVFDRIDGRWEVDKREEKGEWKYVSAPFKQNGDVTKRVAGYMDEDVQFVAGPFSRVGSRPTSMDKADELKRYLLNQGWEPEEWNYSKLTGERTSPKLSQSDSFQGVEGRVGHGVTKYIVAKQRLGTLRGWLDKVDSEGILRGSHSGLATTGRLKHSIIVNVPGAEAKFGKLMRGVFVARPGMLMVGVDSAGNQARMLGARMGDKEWNDALLNGNKADGTDEHSLTQKRAGLPTRHMAKTVFYGVSFGARAAKVAKIINTTNIAEATRVRQAVIDSIPGLGPLIDNTAAQWRSTARAKGKRWGKTQYENGYLRGIDGRPILCENEHACVVYQVQSDEAIHMAAALCKIYADMHRLGYEWDKDWAFLIFMHDEFQMECRPQLADVVAKVACDAIAWAGRHFNIALPHEGEAKIGHNWYDCH